LYIQAWRIHSWGKAALPGPRIQALLGPLVIQPPPALESVLNSQHQPEQQNALQVRTCVQVKVKIARLGANDDRAYTGSRFRPSTVVLAQRRPQRGSAAKGLARVICLAAQVPRRGNQTREPRPCCPARAAGRALGSAARCPLFVHCAPGGHTCPREVLLRRHSCCSTRCGRRLCDRVRLHRRLEHRQLCLDLVDLGLRACSRRRTLASRLGTGRT